MVNEKHEWKHSHVCLSFELRQIMQLECRQDGRWVGWRGADISALFIQFSLSWHCVSSFYSVATIVWMTALLPWPGCCCRKRGWILTCASCLSIPYGKHCTIWYCAMYWLATTVCLWASCRLKWRLNGDFSTRTIAMPHFGDMWRNRIAHRTLSVSFTYS